MNEYGIRVLGICDDDVQKSLERNMVVLWKDTSDNLSTTERHDENE